MTNKQYHRKVRALSRTSGRKDSFALNVELLALHRQISEYRKGGMRAMNGLGSSRHPSGAAA